ncbi:MAG: serine/threonine protein kinase [Deltaproteobacteria bacterium]|nr:serine/threonine protein kinase [Deltaproteobacteria bacterium]MDQ3296004.1 serine/threonine protein kinase [Myxococcota bacterium]
MAASASGRLGEIDRIGLYRIEDELSADTTGISYRVVHQVLPRHAVLKVMHAPSLDQPAIKQPLAIHVLREACILEALQHPGVARLYESGMLPDRRPWFARELVDGAKVTSVLPSGSIDRIDAIAMLRDIAAVLDHAARRGVIHCGLRPDRIVLTGRARGFPVCIPDWADARAHDAANSPCIPNAASWSYTSPELVCGDPIDDRTDVYALGVIAYQILTGTLPYSGHAIATASDGSTQHVPTEVHCPEVPPELTRLVDQMLARDRWDRPSIAEVLFELTWLVAAIRSPIARKADVLRIRKPRWTPSVSFTPIDDALAQAIDDANRDTKR